MAVGRARGGCGRMTIGQSSVKTFLCFPIFRSYNLFFFCNIFISSPPPPPCDQIVDPSCSHNCLIYTVADRHKTLSTRNPPPPWVTITQVTSAASFLFSFGRLRCCSSSLGRDRWLHPTWTSLQGWVRSEF